MFTLGVFVCVYVCVCVHSVYLYIQAVVTLCSQFLFSEVAYSFSVCVHSEYLFTWCVCSLSVHVHSIFIHSVYLFVVFTHTVSSLCVLLHSTYLFTQYIVHSVLVYSATVYVCLCVCSLSAYSLGAFVGSFRPPGHHAECSAAMGFCFFNNVAIAAAYAKDKFGIKRFEIVCLISFSFEVVRIHRLFCY